MVGVTVTESRSRCLLAWVSLLAAAGCGGPGSEGGGGSLVTGTIEAELSTVPPAVACVQLALSGSVTSTTTFVVSPGDTPVRLSVGALPAGTVTVVARAFDLACGSVTAASTPSWVGSPVSAAVTPGLTTSIAVTLRLNLPVAVDVDFLAAASSVGAGGYASYAVLKDGTLRAWGYNGFGQLGNGTLLGSGTPVPVSGLSGVVAIAPGLLHACALDGSMRASCWGYGGSGQLGNGGTADASAPVAVAGSPTFRTLIAGAYSSCGTTATGTVCWGYNASGQLGTCNAIGSAVPVSAPCLPGELVASGPVSFTTLAAAGILSYGAGENGQGQLGVTPSPGVTSLTQTGYFRTFLIAATAGRTHTCAIEPSAGTVLCAGDNSFGEVGNGAPSSTPVVPPVSTGLTGAIAVTAGAYHTCALKADGSVWCWGYNAFGQLGDGTGVLRPVPTPVRGLTSGVVSLGAGAYHTCAVKDDGTVWCWGYNGYGQLGDGSFENRGVPTRVRL